MEYWFVNCGEIRADLSREYQGGNRSWDDCRRLGFISAGQDRKYSDRLRKLYAGAEIFAYLKGSGYVGHGKITTDAPIMARDFVINGKRLLDHDLKGTFLRMNVDSAEKYVRPTTTQNSTGPNTSSLRMATTTQFSIRPMG